MKRSARQNFFFITAVVLLVLVLTSSVESIRLYVNWQFFQEVGFSDVFRKTLLAKIFTGFAFFAVTFLFFFVNMAIAHRMSFPRSILHPLGVNIPALSKLDIGKFIRNVSYGLVGLASVSAFLIGTKYWQEMLLFLNSQPAGVTDPVFGKDVAHYLFTYPVAVIVNRALTQIILLTAALLALNYFLRGGVAYVEGLFSIDRRVKKHLLILLSLFLLNLAFMFYLDRFALLTKEHSIIYGASYADVHARLLMLNVMTVIAAASSLFFLSGFRGKTRYTPLVVIAVFIGTYVLGLNIAPSLLQNFKVAPNELVLERPFIENHIRLTRFGYGLERIETEPFEANESLVSADVNRNISTIRNIRLWDEDPLLKTYSQLQQIRTYYRFVDVDNDRYTLNGKYLQVMLSPREISYDDLPGKSWINERLVYTHGIGLAMGPVSGITREGLPEFIVKDIPPVGEPGMNIVRPEIYYGEKPNDYVIVKTAQKEFSYPTTEGNVYSTYEGTGGIRLASLFSRLLYAAHFGTFKILLSSDISEESRIMYNRNIMARVDAIAPFLLFDSDPYMVVSGEGRLYWIIDAYSYTDRLPYSRPIQRGINYIRNPVKAVVDAYDGSVAFYTVDDTDILIRTYSEIFPTLFKPMTEMPEDLKQHIRYPRNLLRVQAQMFATFHMTDPTVYYNKEDLWEIPSYKDKTMEPYFLVMKLPKREQEEFVLLLPFTPAKRDNLAAWMAARCDGEEYGKIIVYTFPRDRLVFGPRQVDARIDQDAYISQQLTLWGQRGSDVIRGSLLIIPIENSLMYVQPLYLVATDRVGLPELRRVIVAFGSEVVMEETLESAMQKLFRGQLPLTPLKTTVERSGTVLDRDDRSARALDRLRKARESLRNEDWAGFGRYLKEAEELLRESGK